MLGIIPKRNPSYPRDKEIKHLSILDINPADEILSSPYPILTYPRAKKIHAGLPSEKYKNIVSYYHQINGPDCNEEIRTIYPTGNAGIVFLCDPRKPDAYFVGTLTHPREAEYAVSGSDYFVVLFWPGMSYTFFPVPQTEFADRYIPLDKIMPGKAESLIKNMVNAGTFHERVNIFEDFLEKYLPVPAEIPDRLLCTISAIYQNIYNIENKKMKFYNYSERHTRRLFLNYVGISPKLFNCIIRHQKILKILNSNPYKDMAGFAAEQGYSDQSHFIREFKRFNIYSPSNFIKEFIRTDNQNLPKNI